MLAVIGGGHFGSYHARQLLKAVRAGRLPEQELVVVDRDPSCAAARSALAEAPEVRLVRSDWLEFLRAWLRTAAPGDQLVPAPLAPHLLWEWLALALGATPAPVPRGWGLPYEQPGPGLELFLSAAAWTCPAACVEPAHCPVLHAPRDWDLARLIEERAEELGLAAAVFQVLHLAGGVASVPVGALLEAREQLSGEAAGRRALVATSSRCHAAVGALRLGGAG